MILTARHVKRPRQHWICDWCERPIAGPHIYLYGAPDTTDRPSAMRLHVECCPNHSGDTKIAAAKGCSEPSAPTRSELSVHEGARHP